MTFRVVLTCLFAFNGGVGIAKAANGKDTDTSVITAILEGVLIYGVWNWL